MSLIRIDRYADYKSHVGFGFRRRCADGRLRLTIGEDAAELFPVAVCPVPWRYTQVAGRTLVGSLLWIKSKTTGKREENPHAQKKGTGWTRALVEDLVPTCQTVADHPTWLRSLLR